MTYAPGHGGYPGGYAETDVPVALYDLAIDPGETHDVAAQHPDIVDSLQEIVSQYRKELGDDITHTDCTACRPAAKF